MQQIDLNNVKAAGIEELASHFLSLEKTVQNMALQLNNVEQENVALRVTVDELEVEVIDLQARLEYVEAVTRKDGEHVNHIDEKSIKSKNNIDT